MRRTSWLALLLLLFAIPSVHGQSPAPARGPEEARSQIEVFLAFGDEASGRLAVVLETLTERHPTDVRIVFRHATLEGDAAAALPHHAALAADRQGKFWAMAQLLFANQDRHARDDVIGMAHQLGLDVARFGADLDDQSFDGVLQADRARAAALGVTRAPAMLIDDARYAGEPTLEHIEAGLKR